MSRLAPHARRMVEIRRRIEEATATTDPVEAVSQLADIADLIERAQLHLIRDARDAGTTWARIGHGLAMTRQAAHQAYAHRLPDPTGTPPML